MREITFSQATCLLYTSGVINVSGTLQQVHPHTLGMVVAAARAIENGLATYQATEELRLQHKYQEAIVESMSDGFLTIDVNLSLIHI